jgi:hypothetical protein
MVLLLDRGSLSASAAGFAVREIAGIDHRDDLARRHHVVFIDKEFRYLDLVSMSISSDSRRPFPEAIPGGSCV